MTRAHRVPEAEISTVDHFQVIRWKTRSFLRGNTLPCRLLFHTIDIAKAMLISLHVVHSDPSLQLTIRNRPSGTLDVYAVRAAEAGAGSEGLAMGIVPR